MVQKIKPIFEENFYNLDRSKKYEMILKKSLQAVEFHKEKNIDEELMTPYIIG
jgi:hypothetical protein